MADGLRLARSAARLELQQFKRARAVVLLAVLEAITFLVLVSLFGLTGSRAPTALVDRDGGTLSSSFVQHLEDAHHSFDLRPTTRAQAERQLRAGEIVAIITIPKGFTARVAAGRTVVVPVVVDNVNTDLTDDVREAVPSAIASFGRDQGFGGVRLTVDEHDLIDHDTGYVPYLVVSALVVDALVVAGILGALSITREVEGSTLSQWRLSPAPIGWLLLGKLAAAAGVAALGVGISVGIVVFGYGITPRSWVGAIGGLALCVVIFTVVGACVGAVLRRSLPVAALYFGVALPLYLGSGGIEPERFDPEPLWRAAHLTPVYSAIAVVEHSFHGFRITPESVGANVAILLLWGVAIVAVAAAVLDRLLGRS